MGRCGECVPAQTNRPGGAAASVGCGFVLGLGLGFGELLLYNDLCRSIQDWLALGVVEVLFLQLMNSDDLDDGDCAGLCLGLVNLLFRVFPLDCDHLPALLAMILLTSLGFYLPS